LTKFFNFEQIIGGHTPDFTSVDDIATAKVVRTQTEDKTIEIQAFQGFPLLPAPCPLLYFWCVLL
jgi:hypothetical protein